MIFLKDYYRDDYLNRYKQLKKQNNSMFTQYTFLLSTRSFYPLPVLTKYRIYTETFIIYEALYQWTLQETNIVNVLNSAQSIRARAEKSSCLLR